MKSILKHDLLPSIVVFLVALPLCMGIAIASGVPVAAGLVTGIVGGLVVGVLAGSPLQVSGPAAGLTVIVAALVHQHGLAALGPAVLIAGALQLTAGVFRLGQWFRAVSPAVIQGMLAGIGVLIFASQFHVMVDDEPRNGGLENLATIPQAIEKGLPWPELRSREERILRVELMQSLGTIQAVQRDLREEVGRIDAGRSDGSASAGTVNGRLEELASRQENLHARLSRVVETIHADDRLNGDADRLAALREKAAAALAQSAAARRDLWQGRLDQAMQSQEQTVASLAEINKLLRNHDWAAKIGLLTIGAILLWQGFVPKRFRLIPAPLIAVALASTVACALYLPILYVSVPDNLLDDLNPLSWSGAAQIGWMELLQAGLVLAAVASAETLLCATAVDQMHSGPRTRYDKELSAQGIGNMICGALGALPMTGVIVRSSANVNSGARTRASAFLHGLWLLVFVVFLTPVVRLIPTSVLAAILVYTGYKLMNPRAVVRLWNYGKGEVVVYAATVVTIVAVDLLTGVIAGIVLAAFKLLLTFSRLRTRLWVHADGGRATLRLRGAATFLRLPKLAAALEEVPPAAELHVDLTELDYIDHACLELLTNWAKQHEATGGRLAVDWDTLHATFRRRKRRPPAKEAVAA